MHRYTIILIILCSLFITSAAHAKHLYKEKVYQLAWCRQHQAVAEYVLDDRSRVDCLNSEYAVEVDFAPKWAEAIGQALYYAHKTHRKPGVVIIAEKPYPRLLKRLFLLAATYNVSVWVMRPDDIHL